MRNKILLDCTFRDGGYYNKWNFDLDLFIEYLGCMDVCKVDIVEIGFRFNIKNKNYGDFAFTTDSFLKKLPLPKKIKYAAMINAKDFYDNESIILKIFDKKQNSKIDIVRIAINYNEYKKAKEIIKYLNLLNYKVGLNLMQAHDKKKESIIETIEDIKKWNLKIDYFYYADSLGCMDSNYIRNITTNIKDCWPGAVGIHAHNNKSMALSNTLAALNAGADICDSTILGMGRGAGNAQTEFLLQELKGPLNNLQLKKINSLISRFNSLKLKYNWGYNFLYYYAANNKIHPTYIQTLISEKRYSEVEILSLLNRLSAEDLLSFSKSKIDEIFFEKFQDLDKMSPIKLKLKKSNKAYIVGNGLSILPNKSKIKKLITNKKFTTIFLNNNNFLENKKYADITVVVNTFRLLSDLNKLGRYQLNLIAPINKFKQLFKTKLKNKKIQNYPVCIKQNTFIANNKYTILPYDLAINYALSLCKLLQIEEVYLIGIDGYEDIDKNEQIINSLKLFNDNYNSIKIYSYSKSKIKAKFVNFIQYDK